MFTLPNKSALITGAGSGIGRATAEQFARAGATLLFLTGRRREKLTETAELISSHSPKCRVLCIDGDVSDGSFREKLVKEILSRGPLNFLVNNAGVYLTPSATETSDEHWNSVIGTNLDAAFALSRDLLPALEAAENPAIVNIGSTLSLRPIPQGVAYNVSKAGLDHLTRSLANEWGPRGIRVNCVSPGITETPMYRGRYDSDEAYELAIETATKWHPLKRVGRPEDIAYAVQYLCSDASGWVTGVILPVDGGLLVT